MLSDRPQAFKLVRPKGGCEWGPFWGFVSAVEGFPMALTDVAVRRAKSATRIGSVAMTLDDALFRTAAQNPQAFERQTIDLLRSGTVR